jgi:hypothetical protein
MSVEQSINTNITVTTKKVGDDITPDTFLQMLNILENLTDHTHIFYDDYSTNCNCNCACACGRGGL